MAFITMLPSAPPPMRSSPSVGRFSPRRRIQWTLALVRRHLQPLLLRRLPSCPLCGAPSRTISCRAVTRKCDQVVLGCGRKEAGAQPSLESRNGCQGLKPHKRSLCRVLPA